MHIQWRVARYKADRGCCTGCEYLGFVRLGLPGAEGPGLCSPEEGGKLCSLA